MDDQVLIDEDEADKRRREEILREANLVWQMTHTDGWKIVERELKREKEEQQKTLMSISMTPENLPALAVAQAQAKACDFPLDLVKQFAEAREQVLAEVGLTTE